MWGHSDLLSSVYVGSPTMSVCYSVSFNFWVFLQMAGYRWEQQWYSKCNSTALSRPSSGCRRWMNLCTLRTKVQICMLQQRQWRRRRALCMDSVWEKHAFFPHFVSFISSTWRICLFKASDCSTLTQCSPCSVFSLFFHPPSSSSLLQPPIVCTLWPLIFNLSRYRTL